MASINISNGGKPWIVSESGTTRNFEVSLNSEPPGRVQLNFSSVSGHLVFSQSYVRFNYTDYSIPVRVTVGAIDDSIDQGRYYLDQIQMNVSSTDSCLAESLRDQPCGQYPAYDGVLVQRVEVNITDNDVAGIVITKWKQKPRL